MKRFCKRTERPCDDTGSSFTSAQRFRLRAARFWRTSEGLGAFSAPPLRPAKRLRYLSGRGRFAAGSFCTTIVTFCRTRRRARCPAGRVCTGGTLPGVSTTSPQSLRDRTGSLDCGNLLPLSRGQPAGRSRRRSRQTSIPLDDRSTSNAARVLANAPTPRARASRRRDRRRGGCVCGVRG